MLQYGEKLIFYQLKDADKLFFLPCNGHEKRYNVKQKQDLYIQTLDTKTLNLTEETEIYLSYKNDDSKSEKHTIRCNGDMTFSTVVQILALSVIYPTFNLDLEYWEAVLKNGRVPLLGETVKDLE